MEIELDTTLITGASEGIGKCFAEEFARQGHNLVLVARNEVKLSLIAAQLSAAYQVQVDILPLDLTRSNAIDTLQAEIIKKGWEIDILVNNAGVLYVDDFAEANPADLDAVVQLNIGALVKVTRAMLGAMLKRDRGKVINVASVASFIPTPRFAVYGASKSFVLSFTESLSEELRMTGVDAHCICPGFTRTNMLSSGKGLEDAIPDFVKGDPDELVAKAYKACMKGEVIYIDKAVNKTLVQWAKLYPRWMVRGVSGFLSRLK